ncbi:precorrin-6A reductase [Primorskyibacter flagellatus]|uniref:Precorrin-6A reductase n=1 Tax=Primorskyibacter flagellatus TaxID=1387277 RepID=A0A917A5F5_9RHOB|nr:cobalt-precorrin-6A reductase [Primorskyibacter flagellatus]GGE28733.1 precorrin-6A reductase [Primorskyibacter flagellatus]
MTLLLLSGTGEAHALARALAAQGTPVLASLAGALRSGADYPVPLRTGGFGGAEGFIAALAGHGITAVLDATHPFATRITIRTARLCRERGLPYARLSRPAWQAGPGDRWHTAVTAEEAAALVPDGATVLLATGIGTLDRYAGLAGRTRVHCRRIDPDDRPFPFAGGSWLTGRGPFDLASETALFRRLGITWIVTKNAGGQGARPKLDAARALGLDVAMIARPPDPEGCTVLRTVPEALDWVAAR